MEVDCFPVRIVTGIEDSSVVVGFVREYELQLCPVVEGSPCHCPIGGVWVYMTQAAWKFRDLKEQPETSETLQMKLGRSEGRTIPEALDPP